MAYFNGKKNFLVSVCTKGGSGIIEVTKLPTNNIDKNAFYLVDGKYYKWGYRSTFLLEQELRYLENSYGYYDTVVNCSGYIYNEESNCNDEFTRLRFWEGSNGRAYQIELERSGWHADLYNNGTYPQPYRHQTITFTEPITDKAFIAWLDENARNIKNETEWYVYCDATGADALPSQVVKGAKFVGANGVVEEGTYEGDIIESEEDPTKKSPSDKPIRGSVVRYKDKYYKYNETNVLVFNDELSIPEEMCGNEYYIGFSAETPKNGVKTFDKFVFAPTDTVHGITYDGDTNTWDDVYDEQGGWVHSNAKTITITEMPTDDVFLEWLRANATAEGSWTEYADTTSNVPIASETWVFNEELTNIDKPFENGYEDVACSGYMLYDKVDEPFNFRFTSIRFEVDRENGSTLSVYLRNSDTNGIGIYYIDNFTYNFRHGTITFTELPDDEVFLAWLKENATKQESVVGTWVFNETLTSGITVIDTQEKFEQWTNGGLYCELKGYALFGDEKVSLEAIDCVYFGSTFEEYEEGYIAFSETNDAVCYDPDEGWTTRKIVITEQPAPEVVTWLKANATKQTTETTGATAYTAKSVDELPNDAPDGSMALVESDSIVGEWLLKDTIDEEFDLYFDFVSNGANGNDEIVFACFYNIYTDSGYLWYESDFISAIAYSADGWKDESCKSIKIISDGDNPAEAKEVLERIATRISGGTSLYIRKNGEWVYEREANLNGGDSDADDSIVGTWVFKDELTMPDEMQTCFYCDYYANTNDGLKRMNVVYINFVDEENSDNFVISYYGDEYSVDDVYEKAYGWSLDSNDEEKYKTIKILTEPTDQTFIAWLKANATKQTSTGATAYTAKSVDELPNDAPEGSTAIVDSDSVQGEWQFNCEEPLNFDDLKFDLTKNMITYVFLEGYSDMTNFFSNIQFYIRDGEITVRSGSIIYADGEWDDMFNPFKFYGDVIGIQSNLYSSAGTGDEIDAFTKEQFLSWLKTNAERLSGGHSLYIRQNGEWVYNSEVS